MNMNVRKTNGVKLLAAVMVMAMVFVGASVILSDSEVNAAPATGDLIDLTSNPSGENWEFTSETKTLALNGVNLDQGFYYNGDLTITVAGDNTITVNTTAEAGTSAFAAIYATGIITIQDDDSDATTDELTITVNGKTTGSGGSEWTYGIYAGKELSISDIAVDITVATADKYAFAIRGNGNATTFSNVTGTIDGGNRAIQMGTDSTLTFSGCDLTLTGSEKAIQSKMTGGKIVIKDNSIINAKINPNYAGNFEGQKPSIEQIVMVKAVKETEFDALKTGSIDVLNQLTDGDEINTALDLVEEGGYGVSAFERNGYGQITFQCDFGPTQFEAVRHAVAYLLDRTEFANQFCQGHGAVVHGPYGLCMWMYKDSEEMFASELNTYAYDPAKAVEILEADGWVLDAEGNPYVSGTRYKEVTPEEAGDYALNVTLADGRILMPLHIMWASSEDNPVSELLAVMLSNGQQTADAGMVIEQTTMTFDELLLYMYRDATQGDKYGVPTYGMYNLATGFTPMYDQSYMYTLDPKMVELGWNQDRIYDEELDQLSMDMVYGVEAGDDETYLELFQQFIIRWNELLPEIPLYSNVYYTIYPDWLTGYEQDSMWEFNQAILYASIPTAE